VLIHILFCLSSGSRPAAIDETQWRVANAVRFFFENNLSKPNGKHNKEIAVNSAKLRVHITKVHPENLKDKFSVDMVLRVNVYQILSIKNSTSYTRSLLDSKIIPLTEPSQQSFEIKTAVQSWINDNDTNLGIEIASEAQDINELIELEMPDSKDLHRTSSFSNSSLAEMASSKKPSVDVYAQVKEYIKRVKRRTKGRRGTCRRKSGETKCCRYPIKISFADIEYDDWIIAPHEYKGYYCAGDCPHGYKSANTFSIIKSILNEKYPKKVPPPCCAATKLRPFTILHYNHEGGYQFSEFPDLVVEQCKCG